MKVLYVAGAKAESPDATSEQLARLSPDLKITTVTTAAEALAETRRGGGFLALLTSPWLAHNETLALIVSLRRDRVPIAIVPVVAEAQRDFFASAVAAGADDVLLLRGETLVRAHETLTRIRQSPHVNRSSAGQRLRVLYAGRDTVVWNLLEQIPFVTPERATCSPDGACLIRTSGSAGEELRCDAVIVDDPAEAHPLQVLKSVKGQASDLPVVLLATLNAGEIETAALDLGADDTVVKGGIYRRRLIATLRRIHQQIQITRQHTALRAREGRLRQIVETLPQGLGIISEDGVILAMNAAALPLFGATRPTDVVGRDFLGFTVAEHRGDVSDVLGRISGGEPGSLQFDLEGDDKVRRPVELRGVLLERDARGGRGVVALLQAPAARAGAGLEDSVDAVELRRVSALLADVEAERNEWQETLSRERLAWEAAREELETRCQAAEAAQTTRADADAAFADAFTSERAAWDEARRTLENQLADLQAERDEIGAALGRARDERDTAQADAANVREALEARLLELESARDAASTRADEFDGVRRSLDAQVEDARAARADLERRLATSLEAASEHDRERARWDETRRDLETRLAAVTAEKAEIEDRLGHLERRLGGAETAAAALRSQLESENGSAEALRETERALEEARHELRQVRDALETATAAWVVNRLDFESRIDESERARHELADRLAERDGQRLAIEVRLEDAERTIRELERQLQDAARLREHVEHDLPALRDAHERLEAELESATAARAALAEERRTEQARREALERDLDDVRRRAAALEEELRHTDQRRNSAEHAHRELERAHADLEARHRELVSSHDALASRLADLDAVAARLPDVAATLDAVRAELAETMARHAAELAQARDRHAAELAEARDRYAAERVSWEAERADLASRLQLDDVEREAYEVRLARAAQTEAERQRLEDALHSARAEQAALAAARTAERAAREHEMGELDGLRQALEQERARRAVLKERLRDIGRQADERRAALEVESVTRRAIEQQLADALRQLHSLSGKTEDERSRIQDALDEAVASRDRLLGSHLFGHAVTTLEGHLVRCNNTFAHIFGYADADDAVRRTADRPFPPMAGRGTLDARLARDRHIDRADARLARVDGRPVQVVESATIVASPSGDVVERTVIDLSTFLTIEDRLRQARRMEEVGALAASMSPEIERLLEEIDRGGQSLIESIAKNDPRRQPAETIVARRAEASDLVRQLLAFSRKQVAPIEAVDLGEIVTRAEPMLRQLVGGHIVFELQTGTRAAIGHNQDDLSQLLTTLVVAARGVLPVGGKIVVETERVDLDASDVEGIVDARPGPRAVLAITASGYGVTRSASPASAEVLARRCGAFIRTTGEPSRTAAFEVYFPCLDTATPPRD